MKGIKPKVMVSWAALKWEKMSLDQSKWSWTPLSICHAHHRGESQDTQEEWALCYFSTWKNRIALLLHFICDALCFHPTFVFWEQCHTPSLISATQQHEIGKASTGFGVSRFLLVPLQVKDWSPAVWGLYPISLEVRTLATHESEEVFKIQGSRLNMAGCPKFHQVAVKGI